MKYIACLDEQPTAVSENARQSASPADFEADLYLQHLDGLDLDLDQKHELLGILWDIMRMCMELDQPPEICERILTSVFAAATHGPERVE